MFSMSIMPTFAYRAMAKAVRAAGNSARMLVNVRRMFLVGLALAGGLATNTAVRHWLVHVLANICILGGIIAAPIVSVVAWIGMVLPAHSLLHQVANVLFGVSLVWLCLAIVGAHTQTNERPRA